MARKTEVATRAQTAKRESGRCRSKPEHRIIRFSIDEDLLARSDALARRLKIGRAQLVARAMRAVLAAEGKR